MERSRRRPARSYPRMARVNVLLLRVLAEELERLADIDERLRLLTVTEVVCDPDLRHATLLFASLSAAGLEALEEQRRHLQRCIATEVRMKRVPLLAFRADPAIAAGARVEEALRRARSGQDEAGESSAP
jgi:ribosome-binding factor A